LAWLFADPQGNDLLVLFKCLLIGKWHALSNPKLEHGLKVQLNSMLFCGLDPYSDLPDNINHCGFRNSLFQGGVYNSLLDEVCHQIEGHGLNLKVLRRQSLTPL
jgi:transposase, IS5 family